ncbi:MAG: type IV pilus secretin PilQ [Magnetococcus sp. YQC-5]
MLKTILSQLLIICLPLMAGCLTSLTPVTQTTANKPATATRIADIIMQEEALGTRITLKADAPLVYKVFQKNDPPRLLLTFPGIKIDSAIQPRLVNLSTIIGIFPSETSDQNGQLELTLPSLLEYKIKENPKGLDLIVLAKNQGATKNMPEIRDARISRVKEGTEIRFIGTGPFPEPKIFRTDNPARMVVDFPGMAGPKENRIISAGTTEASSSQLIGSADKTRMIVELAGPGIAYRVTRDKETPVLYLTHSPDVNGIPSVLGVFFTRDGDDSLTRIQLDREGLAAQSQRNGQDITLLLKKTKTDPKWIRRMDVREFGGPVESVALQPEGDNLLASIHLNQEAGLHEILQKDREILIRVRPVMDRDKPETLSYSGKKVSLDFKDIDIQNALRFMAEIVKINIIFSEAVTGTLTMHIEDVPWDQAMELMLAAKQLGQVKKGNVLIIAPLSEIQKSHAANLVEQESKTQLEPVITEMIPINFAKADDLKGLLEGGKEKQSKILSKQGSVALDTRTNTLIIKDVASNLAQIREMVEKLDRPILQVLIEARIVEVTRNSMEALGINWGFNFKHSNTLAIANSITNAYENQQFDTTGVTSPRVQMSKAPPRNVNLMPNAAGTIGMHLGTLSPLVDLDIELGAMETSGKLTAISSPRILTTNNQAASISQGSSQPYPTRDNTGGTTYSYIEATLSLTVTPQITSNKFIIMDVLATNNTPGTSNSAAPPPINKQEIKTRALVKDGETIVLGGIYRTSDSNDVTGVPHLLNIPVLGWLFKQQTQNNSQRELLVFLTPRIINSSSL